MNKANMGQTDPLIQILRNQLMVVNRGCEVGVHQGETSAKLLVAFPALHLYMVDAWATYPKDHAYRQSGDKCARFTKSQQKNNMRAAYKNTEFAEGRREIIVGTSSEIGEDFRAPPLDFVFIDDDHTLAGVQSSILAWWHTIAPDGILCGHDLGHPRDCRGVWGVTQAVTEFAERIGQTANAIGEVWWIRKAVDSD